LIEKQPETLKKPVKTGSLTLASDGFFPFSDNIKKAHMFGVTHIVQPGGSTADPVVDKACKKYGITHVKTGRRLFYH
jgi:phosphoribosylaminoimidazolecarboxamide formyltransferase/IMP cyclohydrolase